ncbi:MULTISPECIES: helix-turn-helix domain-containing protein [unclassified Pseudodesulfovibrio]|uniref:helix-turn-helix domain-containing protein n=2 Tax=unclassified Pseudodesulfovibrio TaxID=2661612 RepID=UPI000FEBABEF|nr:MULTISPECIES: helix-turn-helix domain-containing protein [unclassified Pseudodesulfovibrio]MCJ2165172.1 helix-turn-helix domain-containing protein [Pseudodesulfovibrio sp. S3-i]RWU03378.1 DNA-binding protein [Pseudodesulfovibrio sp. S3]
MDNSDVPKPPTLLTVREVANFLRVHQRTAYRLITGGSIQAIKIGSQWRVPEKALIEFIETGWKDCVSTERKQPASDQFKLPFD